MTKNQKANAQQLAFALKTVRSEIDDLATAIRNAQPDDRAPLEAKMKEMMDSIGMEYTQNPNLTSAANDGTTPTSPELMTAGMAMLSALTARNAEATQGLPTAAPAAEAAPAGEVELPKPSLWQRFKAFLSRNKKKLIVGVAAVIAAGGAWFYYNANPSTASGVAASVEVTPPEVVVETPNGEVSIFSTIGGYIVRAASAVKGYAVGAWNWVVNLFSKTKEAANDVVVQAETPVAA